MATCKVVPQNPNKRKINIQIFQYYATLKDSWRVRLERVTGYNEQISLHQHAKKLIIIIIIFLFSIIANLLIHV